MVTPEPVAWEVGKLGGLIVTPSHEGQVESRSGRERGMSFITSRDDAADSQRTRDRSRFWPDNPEDAPVASSGFALEKTSDQDLLPDRIIVNRSSGVPEIWLSRRICGCMSGKGLGIERKG